MDDRFQEIWLTYRFPIAIIQAQIMNLYEYIIYTEFVQKVSQSSSHYICK